MTKLITNCSCGRTNYYNNKPSPVVCPSASSPDDPNHKVISYTLNEKPAHPVPITLGKFHNPKVTEAHWRQWREHKLTEETRLNPARTSDGRLLPIRYDEDTDS